MSGFYIIHKMATVSSEDNYLVPDINFFLSAYLCANLYYIFFIPFLIHCYFLAASGSPPRCNNVLRMQVKFLALASYDRRGCMGNFSLNKDGGVCFHGSPFTLSGRYLWCLTAASPTPIDNVQ